MLSRKDYARQMADPARSEAAQRGAATRSRNERRIDSLFAQVERLERDKQELAALLMHLKRHAVINSATRELVDQTIARLGNVT